MVESAASMEVLAREVRLALGLGDLERLGVLLAPDVTWGPPGDPAPPCQNKEQVLSWYRRAQASGASAQVRDVAIVDDYLLVGLVTTGTHAARAYGGQAPRWQVLTVSGAQIVGIVGFAQKSAALAWMSR